MMHSNESPTAPHTPPPYPKDTDSDAIRGDIERTRAEMDATLAALDARLHPRQLLDDFLDLFRGSDVTGSMRRTAMDAGARAVDQVKSNPVPLALIGAGVAWMLFDRNHHDRARLPVEAPEQEFPVGSPYTYLGVRAGEYDPMTGLPYGAARGADDHPDADDSEAGSSRLEKMKDRSGAAAERARRAMHNARGRVSSATRGMAERIRSAQRHISGQARRAGQTAGQWSRSAGHGISSAAGSVGSTATGAGSWVAETSSGLADQTREVYYEGKARFDETLHSHPLAVGVGALSLGILAGLILPRTNAEDRLMGEQADEFKHEAAEMGRDMLHAGKEVVRKSAERASVEARDQGLTPHELARKGKHVAAEAGRAAAETAEDEHVTAGDLREKVEQVAGSAKHAAKEEARSQKEAFKHEHDSSKHRT